MNLTWRDGVREGASVASEGVSVRESEGASECGCDSKEERKSERERERESS